jgi:phosphatidate cytidylyltransferase
MLRTRLWMGSLLILLTIGVLLLDSNLAPWYPFLFALILVLSLLSCHELLTLLSPARRPWPILCYASIAAIILVNWMSHLCPLAKSFSPDPFRWIFRVYVGIVLVGFLAAMASFQPDANVGSDTLSRLSLLLLITAYLGVLPSFLAQLRWTGGLDNRAVVCLALAIFVPKCCDIGAYFTGRFLGKH